MKASDTILFSDLDGTLFATDGSVSPENREAIAGYVAAGGLFAISTGRAPENALTFLGTLPINGPSVVINGGAIYDFGTKAYSHERYMDRTAADPLFTQLIETIEGLDIQLVTPEGILYITPEATANPVFLETHRPCRFVDRDSIKDVPYFKVLLYAPEPRESALKEALKAHSEGLFKLTRFVNDTCGRITFYELRPLGINKGLALRSLRDDPRTKGRAFFAVGDYLNDMELLTEADVGIATANALPELKAVAKYVTVSNDESAVAHVITDIIPNA